MIRPRDDPDLVSRADVAFLDDTQVGTRPAGLREALGKEGVARARPELPAWKPRLGDFEKAASDPPALADESAGDIDPARGQVLPDLAILQSAVRASRRHPSHDSSSSVFMASGRAPGRARDRHRADAL